MTKKAIIDVLGDICISGYLGDSTSLYKLVSGINETVGKADFRIANFEGVVDGDKYTPITKDGPNLSMSSELSNVLVKNLDVDAFCLANNHIGDFGPEGILRTVDFLKENQKAFLGIESRLGEFTPLFKNVNGVRLAFLAVCENEFGTSGGVDVGSSGYVEADLLKAVSDTKKNADVVIVLFHGGVEHYPFPTPGMKKRYRNLIDAGADIVTGMHQHCPCGYEKYEGGIICYGLGNFLFPDISFYENWNVGYIARFSIGEMIEFEPTPYCFDDEGNFRAIDKDIFDKYLVRISQPIQDDYKIEGLLDSFCQLGGYKAERVLRNIGKEFDAKKSAAIKNLFSCESHRELAIRCFEKKIEAESGKEENVDEECMALLMCAIHSKRSLELQEKNDVKEFKEQHSANVIWGLNRKAKSVYAEIRQKSAGEEIIFIDRSKLLFGMDVLGTTIADPESVLEKYSDSKYHICVNKAHFEDIDKLMNSAGIPKENIIWHE